VGIAALDIVAVGIGFVSQCNFALVDNTWNLALANSGANAQGTLGQGNLTGQGALALAGGGSAISLGLIAGAVGGDGLALAGNHASSSNSQKVDNKLTTGDATARNITVLDVDQRNSNGGEGHQGNVLGVGAIAIFGVSVGAISQSNVAVALGSYNTAVANTGANLQFTGPQFNITGQLALSGAAGGGAFALGGGAGAFGGDAAAGALNIAHSTNWQLVCNDLVTGVATAINAITVTASQTNTNHGDANAVTLALVPVFTAGAISQSNALVVGGGDNTAIANSGANVQVAGGQANVTLQGSADAAVGGGSAAVGVVSVAVDGDASAGAGNIAVSDNTTTAFNTMDTGDATAVNQVSVDVNQSNDNDGDVHSIGL
jgi:hypothetical protein